MKNDHYTLIILCFLIPLYEQLRFKIKYPAKSFTTKKKLIFMDINLPPLCLLVEI